MDLHNQIEKRGAIMAGSIAKKLCIGLVVLVIAGCASTHDLTHLGQLSSNHVTLEVVGGATGGCGPELWDFVRVLPDGSSSGFFRVPKGKVLVVTDVDWQYATHGIFTTSKMQVLRLVIENLADPKLDRRAMDSTIMLTDDGKGGLAGGVSESMTSGFVVSSEARICPDVFPGPMGPPGGLQHLILRGYLAPEK